jgi:hypothetical protein
MKIKDIIGRYLPFAWWVLLAIFSIAGIVAGAKAGGFFGICAIIVSLISVGIYGLQALAEWKERNNY